MKVDIERSGAYTVEIQGGFTGPYINLSVSPAVAYELLKALKAKEAELYDLAENYYDCAECGLTHPKSVKICPSLTEMESEYQDELDIE